LVLADDSFHIVLGIVDLQPFESPGDMVVMDSEGCVDPVFGDSTSTDVGNCNQGGENSGRAWHQFPIDHHCHCIKIELIGADVATHTMLQSIHQTST
jgi:hypothetical protein